MKAEKIKLSEVIKSLEVLQKLCNAQEICGTCWLYDPDKKGSVCFLAKEKLDSAVGNIESALEHIAHEHSCIMPEMPYCETCKWGFISHSEDTMPGEEGVETEWHCLYDPEVRVNETAADKDNVAAAADTDQDDRSDSETA